MEAASVYAFDLLEVELEAHGAPEPMRAAARHSAFDEVRHTQMMRALAARFGAEYEAPVVDSPSKIRSLEELAIENAKEGCVGESFAALVAGWQACHARDPVVARTMTLIAADEARHADLSWDVHAWAMARLDCTARVRVMAAMRAAADRMIAQCHILPADERGEADMPDAATARTLVARLDGSLWSSSRPESFAETVL